MQKITATIQEMMAFRFCQAQSIFYGRHADLQRISPMLQQKERKLDRESFGSIDSKGGFGAKVLCGLAATITLHCLETLSYWLACSPSFAHLLQTL
jgi:hypothetical protein